jgi:hypothetical protein
MVTIVKEVDTKFFMNVSLNISLSVSLSLGLKDTYGATFELPIIKPETRGFQAIPDSFIVYSQNLLS